MTDPERNESELRERLANIATTEGRQRITALIQWKAEGFCYLNAGRRDRILAALDSRDRRIAELEDERDALAAAMPSDGADAALAYAAMRTERDALRAQLATPIPHVTPADFAALESVFDELKSMEDRNGPGCYWYLPRMNHELPIGERLDAAIDSARATKESKDAE